VLAIAALVISIGEMENKVGAYAKIQEFAYAGA
jgi:hypothetical protein